MADRFLGEMLILCMLIIVCGRVFFLRRSAIVSIPVLAPAALFLSLVQIIAWGLTLVECVLFTLSLFVFMANINSILCFFQRLYIDHYNICFFIFSSFMLFFLLFFASILIYFRPPLNKKNALHVSVKKELFSGSLREGIKPKSDWRELQNTVVWTFSPDGAEASKDVAIVFLPGIKAETFRYMPYLLSLSKRGYKIISADFFTDDFQWFRSFLDLPVARRSALIVQSLCDKEEFDRTYDANAWNRALQIEQLIKIAENRWGEQQFFLITDDSNDYAANHIAHLYPYKIAGTYSLRNDAYYKTPGFGCIDATDPLTAYFLGARTFDKDLFIARSMALKTPVPENEVKHDVK